MKGEIDRDFYCSQMKWNSVLAGRCTGGVRCFSCGSRHRKWPTPEQYKEEYGEEYPEDGAVYYFDSGGGFDNGVSKAWGACSLSTARMYESLPHEIGRKFYIVCACTPWSVPPNNWRSE